MPLNVYIYTIMRKLFFSLFLIICSTFLAQNFDSLVYASIKLPTDTEKVNTFYKEGFKARSFAPQFAYNCAKQAEFFAGRSGSQKHVAKACNLLGVLFYRKGDLKKALEFHRKALEIREHINDKAGIAISETNLGNVYSDLQKHELAERSYMHAMQINNELGNQKQTANCHINIGVLKMEDKKPEEAERYFLSAYKIAKTTMDYDLEAICLNDLAVVNIDKKSYESAIGNCLDALKVYDIMENEMDKVDCYINLTRAYFKLNDQKNWELSVKKADSLCEIFNNPEAKSKLLMLRAGITENKDPALALQFYKEYMTLKERIDKENKLILMSNDFSEEKINVVMPEHRFDFPYFMLATLLLLSFGSLFIIYRNKR